jgi:hypothetical protein
MRVVLRSVTRFPIIAHPLARPQETARGPIESMRAQSYATAANCR